MRSHTVWGSLVWGIAAIGWTDAPPSVITVDTHAPGTVTAGIQEAIDALPEAGGEVRLPVGVYEVQSTIYLKPDTTLRGYGAGSIIRKSPGLRVLLAEDVAGTSTQDYVTVREAAGLRPGMAFLLGDLARPDAHVFVARVEGTRVFLHQGAGNLGAHFFHRAAQSGRAWKPSGDLKVANQAALYNGFMIVQASRRCVISSLALDGNRAAQPVDGVRWYEKYPKWWERLRGAPYLGGDSRIEHCRVYNAAGVGVSLGSRATVLDCDIGNNYQGIHPGSGPYSRIVRNAIHHNDTKGIMLCLGNYGLIISQNHIYENREAGIGELGIPRSQAGRDGDHFTIISDNVIYRNQKAGIESGQGKYGPEDFVITGNIVMNNWQCGTRYLGPHQVPAGIALFNASRCVIANNRVFDDQDWYPAELSQPVAAGATNLPIQRWDLPMANAEPSQTFHYNDGTLGGYSDLVALVTGGGHAEYVRIADRDRVYQQAASLTAAQPLARAYPAGTRVVPAKTQLWGIFAGGPESAGNVVANNVCQDNAVGGVLWSGRDTAVNGNVGRVVAMEQAPSLPEAIYPFTNLPLPGLAFDAAGGWGPDAAFEPSGRSPGLALTLVNADTNAFAAVTFNRAKDPAVFPLKPNTYYRVAAWVKTEARQGTLPVLPRVFITEHDRAGAHQGWIGYADTRMPARDAQFERPETTNGVWLRVAGEGRTGGEAAVGQVHCRLERGAVGTAWVEGLCVHELLGDDAGADVPAPAAPGLTAVFETNAAARAALPAADGAPGLPGFRLPDGAPARLATQANAYWDDDTLYFQVRCLDPDPAALERRRAAAVPGFRFGGDCVSVLLRPNAANPWTYFQFAVALNGARFGQLNSGWDRNAETFRPAWQSRADVTPAGWTAWLAIPFRELAPRAPAPGTAWAMNIGRNGYLASGLPESSAAHPARDWHASESFGTLVFAR